MEGRTIDHDASWSSHDDPYAVLGLRPGADHAQIVAAYRELAWRHHPDVAGEAETARMARINAAFDLLRDRRRRARYDRETGRATPPRPGNGFTPTNGSASTNGSGDPARPAYGWVRERDGTGGAGPPPGRPSGTVLMFGRHAGWSIGEIARVDPGYLEWLERRPEGRSHGDEIDATLRRTGFRSDETSARAEGRGARTRRFGWC